MHVIDQILQIISEAVYFIFPAYIANIIPVFFGKTKLFPTPIDLGKTYKGKRIFGNHKTYKGIITGTIFAGLSALLQGRTFETGMLIGFSSLLGDLFGAFLKRRQGLKPGASAPFYDSYFDMLFPVLITSLLGVYNLNLWHAVALVGTSRLLRLISSYLGYKLGLKANPW